MSEKEIRRSLHRDLAGVMEGTPVRVCGWVQSVEGSEISLSDSSGFTKCRLDHSSDVQGPVRLRSGDVVEVIGSMMVDGSVAATHLELINRASADMPAAVDHTSPLSYLRFRDPHQVDLLRRANQAERVVRDFLFGRGFVETRMPLLWRAVQEYGEPELRATHPGFGESGYVLLQSPEPPSLLGAIGGLDRAFQFAPCYRWEGGHPSPRKALEFTQLNITTTFTSLGEGKQLFEGLLSELFRECMGIELSTPFPVADYDLCLERYGTDTPDYRYRNYVWPKVHPGDVGRSEGEYHGLVVPGMLPSALIDKLNSMLGERYGHEFAINTVTHEGATPVAGGLRYRGDAARLLERFDLAPAVLLFILSGPKEEAESVFELVVRHGHRFIDSMPVPDHSFVWVEGFPFFRTGEQEQPRATSYHRSRAIFGRTDPSGEEGAVLRVRQADLILNGIEIAGAGEREFRSEPFRRNLDVAQLGQPEIRFGYHMTALTQGAPPLFNLAIGWDRLLWQLLGTKSMYDGMFLPKDGSGRCPVGGLPQPLKEM